MIFCICGVIVDNVVFWMNYVFEIYVFFMFFGCFIIFFIFEIVCKIFEEFSGEDDYVILYNVIF